MGGSASTSSQTTNNGEEEIRIRRQVYEEYERKYFQMERELSEKKDELARVRIENVHLTYQRNNGTEERVRQLEIALKKSLEENDKYKTLQNSHMSTINKLNSDLNELKKKPVCNKEHGSDREDLEKLKVKIQELESENKKKIYKLKAIMSMRVNENKQNKESKEVIKKKHGEELQSLTSKLTSVNNIKTALEKELSEKNENFEKLKQKIQQLELENTNKDKELKTVKATKENDNKQYKQSKEYYNKKHNEKLQMLTDELTLIKSNDYFKLIEDVNKLKESTKMLFTSINDKVKDNARELKKHDFVTKRNYWVASNEAIVEHLKNSLSSNSSPVVLLSPWKLLEEQLTTIKNENEKNITETLSQLIAVVEECENVLKYLDDVVKSKCAQVIRREAEKLKKLERLDIEGYFSREYEVQNAILSKLEEEKTSLLVCLKLTGETVKTYSLVIEKFEEAGSYYDDKIKVDSWIQVLTGKTINCLGVERIHNDGKTPRPLKVTLKTEQDLSLILEKNYPGHISPHRLGIYRCKQ